MTPIALEYCPVRWLRYSRKLHCHHPDAWHELTPSQLITAAKALQENCTDNDLIASMLSIPQKLVKRLSAYQKYSIIDLLSFMETHDPYYDFILPDIGPYHKPQARLKDETFGTFIFAETYFERYASTGNKEFLAQFIACYYRNRPFQESAIAPNSKIIARINADHQEAIYINYFLIREWLAGQYPHVFAPAEDQSKSAKSSWVDVYDAIVGEDIVKETEYANLPISTVLRYLDKRIKQNRYEGKVS